MFRLLVLLAILFAAALGFAWLKRTPGDVALTINDTAYVIDLTTATVALIVLVLIGIAVIGLVRVILRAPWRMARGMRHRKHETGRVALSNGLLAIAAGDVRAAERSAQDAARRLPDQPLTKLLRAQTAQLKGDRAAAREIFREMTDDPATRVAGLRGLYIEAERDGERLAAHQIAERARAEAPSAPWAARALLRHQTAAADWDGALATLSGGTDGRVIDKRTARRQRAVILTAKALAKEDGEPDVARQAALEAHSLAQDLVPAAVVAGRLLARQGDVRRATRVLEATWKVMPHPDITEAYLHARSGDSAGDRLKRAEALHRMRPHADDGRRAVAQAAMDARDFARAREALTPLVTTRPTQRALMLMAALEEAESGDSGRARGWQARAVYAPRDPAWTADGMVLEEWAPISPTTGVLDAVEWKVPVAELEGPKLEIDAAELAPPAGIESDGRTGEADAAIAMNVAPPAGPAEPKEAETSIIEAKAEAPPVPVTIDEAKTDASAADTAADKTDESGEVSEAEGAAPAESADEAASEDETKGEQEPAVGLGLTKVGVAVARERPVRPGDDRSAEPEEATIVAAPDAPPPIPDGEAEAAEPKLDRAAGPPPPDDPGVGGDGEDGDGGRALPGFLSREGGSAGRHA